MSTKTPSTITPEKTIKQKYSSLPKRVLTSVLALSYLSLVIYLDLFVFMKPYAFTFSGLFLSALILLEFYSMAKANGHTPFVKTGVFFTILLFATPLIQNIFSQHYFEIEITSVQIAILIISLISFFWLQGREPSCDNAFKNVSISVLGVIYIGLLGSYLTHIVWLSSNSTSHSSGVYKLLFFIFVTKMTDIGAFMIGVIWGKHKWIPRISPGKSIEGLIGGILSSITLALLLNYTLEWSIFDSIWHTILVAVLFAYCGQLSDLIESIFKRAAGFKDSGKILPGFGGFFDLTDSIIVTAPIAYTLFKVLAK